jgi:hypothetical protein
MKLPDVSGVYDYGFCRDKEVGTKRGSDGRAGYAAKE